MVEVLSHELFKHLLTGVAQLGGGHDVQNAGSTQPGAYTRRGSRRDVRLRLASPRFDVLQHLLSVQPTFCRSHLKLNEGDEAFLSVTVKALAHGHGPRHVFRQGPPAAHHLPQVIGVGPGQRPWRRLFVQLFVRAVDPSQPMEQTFPVLISYVFFIENLYY